MLVTKAHGRLRREARIRIRDIRASELNLAMRHASRRRDEIVSARRSRPVRRLASLPRAASLKTADFIYDLPESLIAQEAAEPRDAARFARRFFLEHNTLDATFACLPSLLPSNARPRFQRIRRV